jgi:hypothetical protein
MSAKSHIHKRCGTLIIFFFSTMRYAEIHKQRPFFDNKKDVSKIDVLEIQIMSTYNGTSSPYKAFVS